MIARQSTNNVARMPQANQECATWLETLLQQEIAEYTKAIYAKHYVYIDRL